MCKIEDKLPLGQHAYTSHNALSKRILSCALIINIYFPIGIISSDLLHQGEITKTFHKPSSDARTVLMFYPEDSFAYFIKSNTDSEGITKLAQTERNNKIIQIRLRQRRAKRIHIASVKEPEDVDGSRECEGDHRFCTKVDLVNINFQYACSCNEDCYSYGDCCWGVPGVDSQGSSIIANANGLIWQKVQTTCERAYVEAYGGIIFLSMVSECPRDDWDDDDEVVNKCELREDAYNRTDDIVHIPVTSKTTKITYKNIYCAFCHQDVDNLVIWNVTLETDNRTASEDEISNSTAMKCDSSSNFSSTGKCWKQNLSVHNSTQGNNLKLGISEEVANVLHACRLWSNPIVSSCPDKMPDNNWFNETYWTEVKTKCSTYYEPVRQKINQTKIFYSNKFCAICNSEMSPEDTIKTLQCFKALGTFGSSGERRLPANCNEHSCHTGEAKLTTIFNYNIWNRDCIIHDNTGCRKISCGKKYVRDSSGICIRRNNINKNLTNNTSNSKRSIEDCRTVIAFKYGEYEKANVDNSSDDAYVISAGLYEGKILYEGEYELKENRDLVVCAVQVNQYDMFEGADGYLSIIGTSISIVALIIKIILHVLNHEVRNLASKLVFHLSVSLLIAQFLFITGSYRLDLKGVCEAIGVIMHYAFLASFFWMNVIAFDLLRTFSRKSGPSRMISSGKKFRCYSIYAWCAPGIIIMASIALEWIAPETILKPYYGTKACWISGRYASLALFGSPLLIILLANVGLFIATVVKIMKTVNSSKMAHENVGKQDRIHFILFIKLALIMGVTWIFAFLIPFVHNNIVRYLFIIFNSSQGLFILLSFTRFRMRSRGTTRSSGTDTTNSSRGRKISNETTSGFPVPYSAPTVTIM